MLGDIQSTIIALGAALAALVVSLLAMRRKGRTDERARRSAQDAADYSKTRKDIDNADLGHGATDADRIRRLQSIADKRGS
jgi:hypothetical protein